MAWVAMAARVACSDWHPWAQLPGKHGVAVVPDVTPVWRKGDLCVRVCVCVCVCMCVVTGVLFVVAGCAWGSSQLPGCRQVCLCMKQIVLAEG